MKNATLLLAIASVMLLGCVQTRKTTTTTTITSTTEEQPPAPPSQSNTRNNAGTIQVITNSNFDYAIAHLEPYGHDNDSSAAYYNGSRVELEGVINGSEILGYPRFNATGVIGRTEVGYYLHVKENKKYNDSIIIDDNKQEFNSADGACVKVKGIVTGYFASEFSDGTDFNFVVTPTSIEVIDCSQVKN